MSLGILASFTNSAFSGGTMASDGVEILMQRMREGDPQAVSDLLQDHLIDVERHVRSRLPMHWRVRLSSRRAAILVCAADAAEPLLRRCVARGMMAGASTSGIWRGVTLLVLHALMRIGGDDGQGNAPRVSGASLAVRRASGRSLCGEDAAFERMLAGLADGFDKALARWLRGGLCVAEIAAETGRREWDIRARIEALPRAVRRFIDGEDNGAGEPVPA